MAIEVYLNFNGNCREAVDFYAKAFQTDLQQIMTFGDVPPNPDYPLDEEGKKLVLHTFLMINGSKIMFSDVMPGMPFTEGNNIHISVMSHNKDDITNYFNALKVGGEVSMELQETFWSKWYGHLTDRFGITWLFNLEK